MPLNLNFLTLPDPDGHKPALLLKGDWLIVAISDGKYTGYGEASHSRDDAACRRKIGELFRQYVADMSVTFSSIGGLETGAMSKASNFVEATAISAINQALYDLLAKRNGVPVYEIITQMSPFGGAAPKPATTPAPSSSPPPLPAYATINRALNERTIDDYKETVQDALEQGFKTIKCAPFEKVTSDGEQVEQAQVGLQRLRHLRQAYPDLALRVDCHERFSLSSLREILPELEKLNLDWLEAPVPIGADYKKLRQWTDMPIALGELFFGWQGFKQIAGENWADVIMPDVKHVGGFGPLINVIKKAPGHVRTSPHNPSGPIATAASLHAAAVCANVDSLEMVLIRDKTRAYYLPQLSDGKLSIPDGPGWGADGLLLIEN